MAPVVVLVAERQHHVVRQDEGDEDRGVPEVAVDVLQDERETRLAGVPTVGLGHGAGGRRQPERPVVRLAVVVAGGAEAEREDQDDERGGELEPGERLTEVRRPGDAVVREAGRVERRDVRGGVVVRAGERPPRRVDHECREHHERRERREPPAVLPERLGLDSGPPWPEDTGRRHPSLLPCTSNERSEAPAGPHQRVLNSHQPFMDKTLHRSRKYGHRISGAVWTPRDGSALRRLHPR